MVVGAGELDERHRLIGAYQGIALGMASRTAGALRGAAGAARSSGATGRVVILVTTLRDGYYLVLSLGPTRARWPSPQRQCEETRDRLNREI